MKLIFTGHVTFEKASPDISLSDPVKTFFGSGDMVCGSLKSILNFKCFDFLKESNISHFNMANSGIGALGATIINSVKVHLDINKIIYTGAGSDKKEASGMFTRNFPIHSEYGSRGKSHFKVGFLSASMVAKEYEALPDKGGVLYFHIDHTNILLQLVAEAASRVDLLIVGVDWNLDDLPDHKIPRKIRALSKSLIKAGAKVVHGNYDKMYPVEIYNNSLIIWSCGPLIGDSNEPGLAVLAEIELAEIPYKVVKNMDYLWYWAGYRQIKPIITYSLTRIVNTDGLIQFSLI